MIFNLMKPVPTTESATMYLYGHEADKTVTYNGVELPELPVWDKETYPYAVIGTRGDNYYFIASEIDLGAFAKGKGGLDLATEDGQVWNGGEYTKEYINDSGLWTEITSGEADYYFYSPVWANYNICFYSDSRGGDYAGTIYLSASDPVTTYTNADVTINGVGYVGAVLPKLPEWDKTAYPYAYIAETIITFNGITTITYFFWASTTPYVFDGEKFVIRDVPYTSGYGRLTLNSDNEFSTPVFVEYDSESHYDDLSTWIWSNYDVTDKDGQTVYFTGTDPIPVYE